VKDVSDLHALADPAPEHLGPSPADAKSVFAELVCADPELLRAEFEALIAANYPPGDGQRCPRSPRWTAPLRFDWVRPGPQIVSWRRSASLPGSPGRTGRIGADHAARERGPPGQRTPETAHTSKDISNGR